MMDNKLIKVLTKNSVKCLICNTILESKYRHDFVMCPCPNQTFVDGGLSYNRVGGKDLSLIENLCEYRTLTQESYDKEQVELKAIQLAKNEQGVKDGLLVKIGNDYYRKEIITLLYDKGLIPSLNLDYVVHMFTPKETHTLLKLHEKLDALTKALHNLNLKAEVFVVDLDEHKTQVDEIKSEILRTLDKINQVLGK